MTTITIKDDISKYSSNTLSLKIWNFLSSELWIDKSLIVFSCDLEDTPDNIKKSYFELKNSPNSDYLDI